MTTYEEWLDSLTPEEQAEEAANQMMQDYL